MSKIVFFCIPAYGHTNPTLGVVRELTARGHEVRYYSYEPMRTLIEAAGAQFLHTERQHGVRHKFGQRRRNAGPDAVRRLDRNLLPDDRAHQGRKRRPARNQGRAGIAFDELRQGGVASTQFADRLRPVIGHHVLSSG